MKKLVIVTISFLTFFNLWAQQPKDTLNTEIVNVVKPYTPTISDAFKIKDNPNISTDAFQKGSVDYKIQSVPVASTFTPSKGKAKKVKKSKKERLYDNYVSLGFGNYTTPLLEAYIRTFPSKNTEAGMLLTHHSSQGGIKDVVLNNSYYDSNMDLYYKHSERYMSWKAGVGASHDVYHWYGLPKLANTNLLDDINPRQSYLNLSLNGEVHYFDSFFKEAKVKIRNLSDSYRSNEFRTQIQPVLEIPISSELLNFQFDFDHLDGSFEKEYNNMSPATHISYSFLNLGVSPNLEILREYLSINLGAKLYYAIDIEKGTGEFKAYPNVTASYQLIEEILTIFGGAVGGLHQNTFAEIVEENPFLSPNFKSKPTDEKYRAYGGFKGKIATNIGYLFKASYADEKNKMLQQLNRAKTAGTSIDEFENYELGNSYGILYDAVKTLSFYGELAIDFSEEVNFGGSANYAIYNTETELEAWNLPKLKASIFADYHSGKWKGTSKLFIMGARKDLSLPLYMTHEVPYDFSQHIVSNGMYLDLNASLAYSFSNQLSAFVKGHNLLTTKYKRFYNYPTQGIQVLGGFTYKFD